MKKIKDFIAHPLFSGSAVMIGGSMVVNVVNYVYHLVVGRMLGPVNYGVLASLFSVLYVVAIVPTSTSVAVVKFISSAKTGKEIAKVYSAINKFVLTVAFGLAAVIVFVSPFVASFLHIDNAFLVILIAPILFFSLITLVNQATSQGILKFMGFVLPNLASSIIKIVFGILLIFMGFGVLGAMFGVLLGGVTAYFISLPYIRELGKLVRKDFNYNIRPFLKYSFPVLLQALAFTSLFTTDIILVKHFLSPFNAGIYAALSTLGKIVFFASSPISSVMFPVISGRVAKGEKYHKIFWASFFGTAGMSLLIVLVYYLFPNLAIGILYGSAYLSARESLIWMGLFISVYTLAVLLVNFSLSVGRTKIIVFPVMAAILQVIFIWTFHSDIKEIIQVSLAVSVLMLLGEAAYLGYNQLARRYAERKS